ncbi:MAG: SMI1/KNR4 family protein [Bacteroidetes bacterium]|nr:SMI1/KNR4 family protein [Bacteroidota bacterium]
MFEEIKNKQNVEFYQLDNIDNSENTIPKELFAFYKEVGYGFLNINNGDINRIMDPDEFQIINKREEHYEFDPSLDIYKKYVSDRMLFFEVNEGLYLTIDKLTNEKGTNSVYIFDEKISDSLEEFILLYLNNPSILK